MSNTTDKQALEFIRKIQRFSAQTASNTAELDSENIGQAKAILDDIKDNREALGFLDYNDSGTPISILTASNPTAITNDGEGAFTNKAYPPEGVTDLWNVVDDKFDWSQLSLGDMIDIRLDFILTTTSNNTEISVDLLMADGGAGPFAIPFITASNFKAIGVYPVVVWMGLYIGALDVLNNPAKFQINTDQNCSIKVNGFYIKVTKQR